MNPDGFDSRTRNNANDVDLNRDFPDQVRSVILDVMLNQSDVMTDCRHGGLRDIGFMWIIWFSTNCIWLTFLSHAAVQSVEQQRVWETA